MIRAFVAHFEDALQSCRSATRRWKKFVRARVVAPGMAPGAVFFGGKRDAIPRHPKSSWMLPPVFVVVSCKLGVSKNSGQIIHFNRVFHYKASVLGYHYFWKHLAVLFLSLFFW